MKSKEIINAAKAQLAEYIRFIVPLLYNKFDWADPEEDEDYEIPTGRLQPIFINVEVDGMCMGMDDRCYEEREMSAVIVTNDGNVVLADEDDNQWDMDEISVEELGRVADALESAYNRK